MCARVHVCVCVCVLLTVNRAVLVVVWVAPFDPRTQSQPWYRSHSLPAAVLSAVSLRPICARPRYTFSSSPLYFFFHFFLSRAAFPAGHVSHTSASTFFLFQSTFFTASFCLSFHALPRLKKRNPPFMFLLSAVQCVFPAFDKMYERCCATTPKEIRPLIKEIVMPPGLLHYIQACTVCH